MQLFADLGADAFRRVKPKHAARKFCVIVEPRQHPNLIPVIKNFMCLLQDAGWGLIVYHGHDRVHYVRMARRNLTTAEYSAMLGDPLFWQCLLDGFKCEHALIFQCDTLLLKGGAAIDAWLKYDYVGALWPIMSVSVGPRQRELQLTVGNGGLSLRNVRVMLAIARNHPYPSDAIVPEDVYFSYWLKWNEAVYWTPRGDEASAFAVEHVHDPDAAGLHAPSVDVSDVIQAAIERHTKENISIKPI